MYQKPKCHGSRSKGCCGQEPADQKAYLEAGWDFQCLGEWFICGLKKMGWFLAIGVRVRANVMQMSCKCHKSRVLPSETLAMEGSVSGNGIHGIHQLHRQAPSAFCCLHSWLQCIGIEQTSFSRFFLERSSLIILKPI